MDEAELIKAILANKDLYAELVTRYHVGLIIYCERLVGDRDEAEDIAQEAFVKAYMQLERFDPTRARFSTWLYRIATNLAIDYLRANKRKVEVEDIETLTEATMPTFLEDEEKQTVRKAVSELEPREYRRAVESYYWQGKSYQQIADEASVPINTVRTWLRRAKMQLKEKLS